MRWMRSALLGAAIGVAAMASVASGALAPGDGVDVSKPNCPPAVLPAGAAFAIVGVNGGRPFDPQPCLAQEIQWAWPSVSFYINTANPGPSSLNWPNGATIPKVCVPLQDSLECAEDYGWKAAEDSYRKAVDAQISLGLLPPGATRTVAPAEWWLDVEYGPGANTWRDVPSNVAVLHGAVGFLESAGVARVGFYANLGDWAAVTGNTTAFAGYPTWLAGLDARDFGPDRCGGFGFTGGGVAMWQYAAILHELDGDVRCPVTLTMMSPEPATAGHASAPAVLTLNIVQGTPTEVALTTNQDHPSAGLSTSPTGPFTKELTAAVAPRGTTLKVYFRSRRAGRVTIRALSARAGAALATVTVRPAAAAGLGAVTGPRRVRVGKSIVLRARTADRFGNRSLRGVTWTVVGPRLVRVTRLPDGRVRVTGMRSGLAHVRIRAGKRATTVAIRVG